MDAIVRKQLQIVHPEKVYNYLSGLTDTNLAALFGVSAEEYLTLKNDFSKQVEQAGDELLAGISFQKDLQQIPFRDHETIMAIGESTTDDWLSWFEVLKHCVTKVYPAKNIRFINAAVSGQTTAMALRRLTADLQAKPTLILCMLGINDALQIGNAYGKTQVSLHETTGNLTVIRQLSQAVCAPKWLWIAPYLINEQKQDANPWFNMLQLRWYNKNVDPITQFLRDQADPVLDLQKEFARYNEEELLAEDGIHLSLKGHKAVVEGLVRRLSAVE